MPAVGFSIGVDRVVESSWHKKLSPRIIKKPKIYFIQLGLEAKLKSLNIIEILRKAHIPIAQSLSRDSLGSQLAIAEKRRLRATKSAEKSGLPKAEGPKMVEGELDKKLEEIIEKL